MAQVKSKPLKIREKTITDGILAKYILKYIFKILFRLKGWTAGPASPLSGVAIGAPHTSNWDFIYGIGAAIILDVKVYFSIKESWCRIPVVGSAIMYLGAIPIDRSTPGKGQVDQISSFAQRMNNQRVYFAFTPEGTRSKVDKWKTGFYHVALDCKLPIHLGKLDYQNKVVSIFHTFRVTGDKEHDVSVLLEAYKLIRGNNTAKQYPDYSGPVPAVSKAQAQFMKTLYQIEMQSMDENITEEMHVDELPPAGIKDLLKKMLVDNVEGGSEDAYKLTVKGKGCLLHLYSSLTDF